MKLNLDQLKDINSKSLDLHQIELASKFSDRIIGLSNGSIVFNDEAKFLKKNINKLYI